MTRALLLAALLLSACATPPQLARECAKHGAVHAAGLCGRR